MSTVTVVLGSTTVTWSVSPALEPMVDDAAVDAGYVDAADWWRKVTVSANGGAVVEHLDNLIRELIALDAHCRKLNPPNPEVNGDYDGLLGSLRAMRSFAHDYPALAWTIEQ